MCVYVEEENRKEENEQKSGLKYFRITIDVN